jgi:hypothetical protein
MAKPFYQPIRAAGFNIPVMSQGALYVFADASSWTDDAYPYPYAYAYAYAYELLEKAAVGVAPGVDFVQAGKRAVRSSYASCEENIREAATYRLAQGRPPLPRRLMGGGRIRRQSGIRAKLARPATILGNSRSGSVTACGSHRW